MGAADAHPDGDALEGYELEVLSEPERAALEEHLLVCQWCRTRLVETEVFVAAMTSAAFLHRTAEGPVLLTLSRNSIRLWEARVRGADVDALRVFADRTAAQRYLRRTFAELFPEHRCEGACGPP